MYINVCCPMNPVDWMTLSGTKTEPEDAGSSQQGSTIRTIEDRKVDQLVLSLIRYFMKQASLDSLLKLSSSPYLENILGFREILIKTNNEENGNLMAVISGSYIDLAGSIVGRLRIPRAIYEDIMNGLDKVIPSEQKRVEFLQAIDPTFDYGYIKVRIEVLSKPTEVMLEEKRFYVSTGTKQSDLIQPYVELVRKVKLHIKAQRELGVYLSSPFIWVVAPSGSGKTQLAYTLNANGCICLYFVMDTSNQAQYIYRTSKDISAILKSCMKNDILLLEKTLDQESDLMTTVMSCSFLSEHSELKLQTIGFIHSLLSRNEESSTIKFAPMTYSEFSGKWSQHWLAGPDANKMPCVVIDEFSLEDGHEQRTHLFARNIMRALGLVTIVMGTNSHAGNLVKPVSLGKVGSVGSGEVSHPWVYVVHRLPRVSIEHTAPELAAKYMTAVTPFKSDEKWTNFFQWIEGSPAPTCRPRFFRYALEALIKYFQDSTAPKTPLDALDYLLEDARKKVEATKYLANYRLTSCPAIVEWGVIGQVLNLLPRAKSGNLPSDLIHCYFADMYRPDPEEVYFSLFRRVVCGPTSYAASVENQEVGLEDEQGVLWKGPTSVIRTAYEEQLGTLIMLTSCLGRRSLLLQKGLSLSGAFFTKYFLKSFPSGASPEKDEPMKQINGFNFELFVQLAVIVTSAESDSRFRGTRLDKYCSALVAALSLPDEKVVPYELSQKCKLRKFCELAGRNCPIIPLLGPMNEDYVYLKGVLSDPGLPVGRFVLTPDMDRNDGLVKAFNIDGPTVIVEAKYWNKEATNSAISETITTVTRRPEMYGRKHIILFFARSASLDHEKLPDHYTGKIAFFTLCRPDEGKLWFYNNDHFDADFPSSVQTIRYHNATIYSQADFPAALQSELAIFAMLLDSPACQQTIFDPLNPYQVIQNASQMVCTNGPLHVLPFLTTSTLSVSSMATYRVNHVYPPA